MTDRTEEQTSRQDAQAQALVDRLIELLDLEEIDANLFRGKRTDEPWTRVFGGQVVGQALMAACRTVDESRPPHSLHAYFMRPGDPGRPIIYHVFRDRDGGSFSVRRVVAVQNGLPILNLAASFQIREDGLSHQVDMPEAPDPERLESEESISARVVNRYPKKYHAFILRPRTIDFRPVGVDPYTVTEPQAPAQNYWFRTVAALPADQILHRVMLAYASDMTLLATSLLPHGRGLHTENMQEASLDHALWIHGDIKLDDWLLYAQDSPWSGGARGISRGLIFNRDGALVASVAQEGLIRIRD